MADIDTVLFDLDGTLIDTAPDMARALNTLLLAEGRAPLEPARIRPHVSDGAAGLLRLAFGAEMTDDTSARLHGAFLAHYAAGLARDSQPFPGIPALLATIEQRGMRWGVVTNKPGWLTDPLLTALDLTRRAACVVAGDTLDRRKPDPAPLHHACALAATEPGRAVYIGDAERDVQAGRAAGMATFVALFGYIAPGAHPADWGADALLHAPDELWLHVDRGRETA